MTDPVRVIAYGGGVQSTAMVVLAAQGKIDVKTALFCNTGDDSEHPDTLDYVRDVAIPWAADRGVEVLELRHTRRDGTTESIMERIKRDGGKSMVIPVRIANGMPGRRACTMDFKTRVIGKWIKEHGATEESPAFVHLGISVDEIERAGRGGNLDARQTRVYPLLDLGLTRQDCKNVIARAGLPVPPKSACFFCPFHSARVWADLRRDRPDLFDKAQELEDFMNARQDTLGKHKVWLTDRGAAQHKRLEDVIGTAQDQLPGMSDHEMDGRHGCDEGVCFV